MAAAVISGLIILLGMWWFLIRAKRRGREEFNSLDEDCKAFWRLVEWRERHPRGQIGNHPGGVALIQEAIVAHKRFMELHPFLTDKEGSLKSLYNML